MFTDDESVQLISRFMMILEDKKAGKADARNALASELADAAREFLKGRYNTKLADDLRTKGIYQTRDTLTNDDFKR